MGLRLGCLLLCICLGCLLLSIFLLAALLQLVEGTVAPRVAPRVAPGRAGGYAYHDDALSPARPLLKPWTLHTHRCAVLSSTLDPTRIPLLCPQLDSKPPPPLSYSYPEPPEPPPPEPTPPPDPDNPDDLPAPASAPAPARRPLVFTRPPCMWMLIAPVQKARAEAGQEGQEGEPLVSVVPIHIDVTLPDYVVRADTYDKGTAKNWQVRVRVCVRVCVCVGMHVCMCVRTPLLIRCVAG